MCLLYEKKKVTNNAGMNTVCKMNGNCRACGISDLVQRSRLVCTDSQLIIQGHGSINRVTLLSMCHSFTPFKLCLKI